MILRTEPEIRERIRNYTIALGRDGMPEEYYKKIKVAIYELIKGHKQMFCVQG